MTHFLYQSFKIKINFSEFYRFLVVFSIIYYKRTAEKLKKKSIECTIT